MNSLVQLHGSSSSVPLAKAADVGSPQVPAPGGCTLKSKLLLDSSPSSVRQTPHHECTYNALSALVRCGCSVHYDKYPVFHSMNDYPHHLLYMFRTHCNSCK